MTTEATSVQELITNEWDAINTGEICLQEQIAKRDSARTFIGRTLASRRVVRIEQELKEHAYEIDGLDEFQRFMSGRGADS